MSSMKNTSNMVSWLFGAAVGTRKKVMSHTSNARNTLMALRGWRLDADFSRSRRTCIVRMLNLQKGDGT
jgi:hypothetical protein